MLLVALEVQMELPCPVVVQSLLACVPRQSAGTLMSQPECGP